MTFRIVFLEPYTKNIHYNIHAMSVFPLLSWHTKLILHVIKIFGTRHNNHYPLHESAAAKVRIK